MQKEVSLKYTPRSNEKLLKYGFLALAGGVGYYTLEVFYRGYSHFSMALCGAVCMCLIYRLNEPRRELSVTKRILLGTAVITVAEFVTGCIVNLWLGLGVWDYSSIPFNLFGQVCLRFSLIWLMLNIPLIPICHAIRTKIFGES